jgi:hypothetical protein
VLHPKRITVQGVESRAIFCSALLGEAEGRDNLVEVGAIVVPGEIGHACRRRLGERQHDVLRVFQGGVTIDRVRRAGRGHAVAESDIAHGRFLRGTAVDGHAAVLHRRVVLVDEGHAPLRRVPPLGRPLEFEVERLVSIRLPGVIQGDGRRERVAVILRDHGRIGVRGIGRLRRLRRATGADEEHGGGQGEQDFRGSHSEDYDEYRGQYRGNAG